MPEEDINDSSRGYARRERGDLDWTKPAEPNNPVAGTRRSVWPDVDAENMMQLAATGELKQVGQFCFEKAGFLFEFAPRQAVIQTGVWCRRVMTTVIAIWQPEEPYLPACMRLSLCFSYSSRVSVFWSRTGSPSE
jgi:hypothetical protein